MIVENIGRLVSSILAYAFALVLAPLVVALIGCSSAAPPEEVQEDDKDCVEGPDKRYTVEDPDRWYAWEYISHPKGGYRVVDENEETVKEYSQQDCVQSDTSPYCFHELWNDEVLRTRPKELPGFQVSSSSLRVCGGWVTFTNYHPEEPE